MRIKAFGLSSLAILFVLGFVLSGVPVSASNPHGNPYYLNLHQVDVEGQTLTMNDSNVVVSPGTAGGFLYLWILEKNTYYDSGNNVTFLVSVNYTVGSSSSVILLNNFASNLVAFNATYNEYEFVVPTAQVSLAFNNDGSTGLNVTYQLHFAVILLYLDTGYRYVIETFYENVIVLPTLVSYQTLLSDAFGGAGALMLILGPAFIVSFGRDQPTIRIFIICFGMMLIGGIFVYAFWLGGT